MNHRLETAPQSGAVPQLGVSARGEWMPSFCLVLALGILQIPMDLLWSWDTTLSGVFPSQVQFVLKQKGCAAAPPDFYGGTCHGGSTKVGRGISFLSSSSADSES